VIAMTTGQKFMVLESADESNSKSDRISAFHRHSLRPRIRESDPDNEREAPIKWQIKWRPQQPKNQREHAWTTRVSGGIVLAMGGILGGLLLEGGKIKDVSQFTAALIVLGGTFGAVMV